MSLRTTSARKAAVLTAAGLMSLGAATGTAFADGPGAAAAVEKDVTYSCEFPIVGKKDVKAHVSIAFPDSGKVGQVIQAKDLKIDAELDKETSDALSLIGAATIEGTGAAEVDINLGGTEFSTTLNGLNIPKTDIKQGQPVKLPISGDVPGITVKKPGEISFAIGKNFKTTATPKTADGKETELGTFDAPCTHKEGDTKLVTIPVQ